MEIDFTGIKEGSSLFIIGEAGVNHNGRLDEALKLVDIAVDAGCDAVKFQTWITEKVYSRALSIKPEYQQRTTDQTESEFETIKKLELSFNDFTTIKHYCDEKKILFMSTPDEFESADFLQSINVRAFKIGSQDTSNIPFLQYVANKNIPIICSTGASSMAEVAEAVEAITEINSHLMLLHCVSSYPAPTDQLNLRAIQTLSQAFPYPVGFSDHTTGTQAAIMALALGARVFEKHYTRDVNAEGPDHQASLSPEDMKHYVATLREMHLALGTGVKQIMPCEKENRHAFQRYLTASRDIKQGDKITAEDILFMKVVKGILPKHLPLIVGATAQCDIDKHQPITWSDLSLCNNVI